MYICMHKIMFQSVLLFFIMKTVLGDLECLILKNDLSEHGTLTAPVIRNASF